MAHKRAPGAGRKPKGEITGKTETFTTRITPTTRRALDHAAKQSGMSLSQKVEHLLVAAMQKPSGKRRNRALAGAIALVAERIEKRTGMSWREDPFTGLALRYAIDALALHFVPIGDSTPAIPTTIEAAAAKMPPEFAERYRKPAGFGHTQAFNLITEIEQAMSPKISEWSLPIFLDASVEVLGLIKRDLDASEKM
jgi:hypothetical protein